MNQNPISGGMKVAVLIILLVFLYLSAASFLPALLTSEAAARINKDQVSQITACLLSVFVLLVGYYWGAASKNKQEKDENIDNKEDQKEIKDANT